MADNDDLATLYGMGAPSGFVADDMDGGGLNQHAAALDALRSNPGVQQLLSVIAHSEGTGRHTNPYTVGFGGRQINDLSQHPNDLVPFRETDGRRNFTSAAGAYQFTSPTWGDVSKSLGLKDFGPRSQDIAAIELIRRAGALGDAQNGDVQKALTKLGRTWASLPSSPYAQPKRSQAFIDSRLGGSGGRAPGVSVGDAGYSLAIKPTAKETSIAPTFKIGADDPSDSVEDSQAAFQLPTLAKRSPRNSNPFRLNDDTLSSG